MQQLLWLTPHPVFDANGTTKYVLVSHRTIVGLPETIDTMLRHTSFNGSSKGGPSMAGGGGPITAAADGPGTNFGRGTIDGRDNMPARFTSFPGLPRSRVLVYHLSILHENISRFEAQTCCGCREKRWTRICGQTDTRTHTHACTHARTHAHTHTHTHTHTHIFKYLVVSCHNSMDSLPLSLWHKPY